jgi:hypothetical protein
MNWLEWSIRRITMPTRAEHADGNFQFMTSMETNTAGEAVHGLDVPADEFEDRTVLVLAPVFHPGNREECLSQTGGGPAAPTDVLYVSFTRRVGRTIESWRDSSADGPERFGVVRVSDSFPVAKRDSGEVYPTDRPVTVENTSLPPDLTGLGIAFGEFLDTWADDDRHLSICVDSLTALLQYEETDRVCQFVRELTRRVTALDADAHYHVDTVVEIPEAHTDQA